MNLHGSARRCFGAAAVLLFTLGLAAASAAPPREEPPSGDLALTLLLKGYPGGR